MIAIIMDTLIIKDQDMEAIKNLYYFARDYGISTTIEKDCLVIHPQKIVLEERDMNYMFSDFFVYTDYKIEYGDIGGEGCDFSIDVYPVGEKC